MNVRRFYHYFPITLNVNQPSMLMAVLNVEQAILSKVKRVQPSPKFASTAQNFSDLFYDFVQAFYF
jgi:hypothetical protein